MKIPLLKKFILNGKSCECTQLFGEHPNQYFYGSKGHLGVDFATARPYKYEIRYGSWTRVPRTIEEEYGRIPIVACHEGTVKAILYDDKKGLGWGVTVTSPIIDNLQYKTIYWHIESPWSSLKKFRWGDILKILRRTEVRQGAIIAIGGNNGQSTGPHLHLGLRVREFYNGSWGKWIDLDPMLYLDDRSVAYHRWFGGDHHKWFYRGKEITREEYNNLNL